MSVTDAERWNARYAAERETWLERQPRRLLQDYAHLLPRAGVALDAASGTGRNGLMLASAGLHVIALDISLTGLRMAMQRARADRLPFYAAVLDLADPWLPAQHFDVILNFLFLERGCLPRFREALKPGGLIFFETFLQSGGNEEHADFYLRPGELMQAFHGFTILHHHVHEEYCDPQRGLRNTEQLIARKTD